jgi:predicted RNase H-like nuclease (RuvC/YqgF family)
MSAEELKAEVERLKAEVERLMHLASQGEFYRTQLQKDTCRLENIQMHDVSKHYEAENARLKAENERLRKAGDAVALEYHTLCRDIYCDGWFRPFKSLSEFKVKQVEAWNAAKDGKPTE